MKSGWRGKSGRWWSGAHDGESPCQEGVGPMMEWQWGPWWRISMSGRQWGPWWRISMSGRSRVRLRCRTQARLPGTQSSIWKGATTDSSWEFHVSLDVSGKPLKILSRMSYIMGFELSWVRFTALLVLKAIKHRTKSCPLSGADGLGSLYFPSFVFKFSPEHKPMKAFMWKFTVSHVLVTQSWPSLCNPVDRCLPGSSVHGILQARILE